MGEAVRGPYGLISVAVLALLIPAVSPARPDQEKATADVVRIRNGSHPEHGVERLQLREIWRAGGAEDDIMFGVIAQIRADADGDIYVLDRQLAEVKVLTSEGRFLRSLSREGEGPGECRNPRDLVLLHDGTVGILEPASGRIIRAQRDGTPAPSIVVSGAGTDLANSHARDEAVAGGETWFWALWMCSLGSAPAFRSARNSSPTMGKMAVAVSCMMSRPASTTSALSPSRKRIVWTGLCAGSRLVPMGASLWSPTATGT